jgi:hypothetical protein
LFFDEPIQIFVFIGAVIILGANFLNIMSSRNTQT